jgi:hypothetical protein
LNVGDDGLGQDVAGAADGEFVAHDDSVGGAEIENDEGVFGAYGGDAGGGGALAANGSGWRGGRVFSGDGLAGKGGEAAPTRL